MEIENFFPKENIIFLENNEKRSAIKEILIRLEDIKKISNHEKYFNQIMYRESLDNTGISKGFAIPHTRNDSVKDLISAFAVSREGIEYDSIDNLPVNYILLSIFPTSMSTKYIYMTGMLCTLFSDIEKMQNLANANTPLKVYSLLKSISKNYYNTISEKKEVCQDDSDNFTEVHSLNLDLMVRLDRLYQLRDEGITPELITKKINDLKKLLDNRLIVFYERMKKKHKNPFAILENDSCSSCHMVLAPVYLKQIKDSNEILTCNYCGRILLNV